MNTFIYYPKCSTCKKAETFLKNNNISYQLRNIKENNPTKKELDNLVKLSKKDVNKFFNTSGVVYRSLNLKDRLNKMSYEEKLEVLSTNGMLVKRPILVTNDMVLIGFKEKEWKEIIK